jgi:hypothetical protein
MEQEGIYHANKNLTGPYFIVVRANLHQLYASQAITYL